MKKRNKRYHRECLRHAIGWLALLGILIWLFVNAPKAYSAPKPKAVKALKDGIAGQILMNDGNNNIADWVDSSAFKGDRGKRGKRGFEGIQGNTGGQGAKGDTGTSGVDGLKSDRGATGKGLRDRYEVQLEMRILDTKKLALYNYYIYDTNNNNHTLGFKIQLKFGKSYEEKLIGELREEVEKVLRLK